MLGHSIKELRNHGYLGINVTVPHKLDALRHCGEVDPDARALGAVNTVRFDPDATRGFNTDGPGFSRAIEDDFGVDLGSLTVAIAGAGGGAGQALATQCVLQGVAKLVLVNRKARMGRNPATGAEIKIPAKKVVKFRVAKAAKDAILAK